MAGQDDLREANAASIPESVAPPPQLLHDLVRHVGLGTGTREVAVKRVAARPVADLVDGHRRVTELGHLDHVVKARNALEVPVPLPALEPVEVQRHGPKPATAEDSTRTDHVAPHRVGAKVAGARGQRRVRVLNGELDRFFDYRRWRCGP